MPADHNETSVSFSLPFNAKYAMAAFNVGWKLVAIIVFVTRMYFKEQSLFVATQKLETRMVALETQMNQESRKQTEATAQIMARFDQLISDRTFYEQTRKR